MSDRVQLPRNPVIMAWVDEAQAMGLTAPILLTADLARLRRVLRAAEPRLTDWEWGLVSHIMDDEAMALLVDREDGERIVSGDRLYVGIIEWADAAGHEDHVLNAEALARRARQWSDLERWALMVRRRAETGCGRAASLSPREG